MGNFSSPYDNSSLGIEQEPVSQKQRMDVKCVHLRCACTLPLYFYDHPKCHWPKCTPPNSLSISAPNFLLSYWPECASPNSFTTQLLYIRMNQFGDSSSALFTKNKTCLNVFVGPGDGGLYPQFNGQRYLKMSDTDTWAKPNSLGRGGNINLIREMHPILVLFSHHTEKKLLKVG